MRPSYNVATTPSAAHPPAASQPPTYPPSCVVVICAAGIVSDHLLERYRGAFAAVLKAQFTSKQLPGGEEGVTELGSQVGVKAAAWGVWPAKLVAFQGLLARGATWWAIPTLNHMASLLFSCFPACLHLHRPCCCSGSSTTLQADLCRALLCEGLDQESLRDESSRPVTLEALTKQRQREVGG